ncbi:MAG: hypothetical protein JJE12_13125, partial [Anaerolineales bacterium]|nr:hypothetical protein [Anaerolineales bacterium]
MEFNGDHETILDGFSNRIRRVLLTSAFIFVPIIIIYLFVVEVSSPNRFTAAAAAQAEPVCYPAIADTYVDSSVPDSNFGGDQNMGLGLFQGTTNQMYLQFDISKIPPDATIISGNV